MNKKYDALLMMLMDKVRNHYFDDMKDVLMAISIANKVPTAKDVEFAALVATVFLLHTLSVDMDTDFPDLAELKPDILKAIAAFEDLKDSLDDYRDRHDALIALRNRAKGKL